VNRRASQNKRSGRVGLTNLVSTLKTQLVGRQELSSIAIAGNIITLTALKLDPLSVGDRPAIVATAFERYKIVQMVFHWRTALPSIVLGQLDLGIHDDAVATISPTTSDDVLNLRVSREESVWKDFSLTWSPVDREKWYYVNPDAVGDPRFVTQAVAYIIGAGIFFPSAGAAGAYQQGSMSGSTAGSITIEYHYLFDGATKKAD